LVSSRIIFISPCDDLSLPYFIGVSTGILEKFF
jgi:hypothetical protein